MVYRIVALIEQAGPSKDANPNISARELINRCQNLPRILDQSSPADRNKLLKRVFTKTWELLQTQTILTERYDGIQFPTEIPTYSKLESTILRFPHNGKKKPDETEENDQKKTRATKRESQD